MPTLHWTNGTVLCPQHLTLQDALQEQLGVLTTRAVHGYGYGVSELQFVPDLERSGQLVIQRLLCRLLDGTVLSVPETCDAPKATPASVGTTWTTVSLVVQKVEPQGKHHIAVQLAADGRHVVRDADLESTVYDESGQAYFEPERVRLRKVRVTLVLGDEIPKGTTQLVIARVRSLRTNEDGTPELEFDGGFLPPMLRVSAVTAMQTGVIGAVTNALQAAVDRLRSVFDRGTEMRPEGGAPDLPTLLEAQGRWHAVAQLSEAHPMHAYTELCGMVARLAAPAAKELPNYEHARPGQCFPRLRTLVLQSLGAIETPTPTIVLPFSLEQDAKSGEDVLVVRFDDEKLNAAGVTSSAADMLAPETEWKVGITAPAGEERAREVAARVEFKLGSAQRIAALHRAGDKGLATEDAEAPSDTHVAKRVMREPAGVWHSVNGDKSLALLPLPEELEWVKKSDDGKHVRFGLQGDVRMEARFTLHVTLGRRS